MVYMSKYHPGFDEEQYHFELMKNTCVFGHRIRPEPQVRRKPLPHGTCYICSRLDPEGRYKNSNPFNKGFFAHCEHFPRVPYPTFIDDDDDSRDGQSPEFLDQPPLSVTVTKRKVTSPEQRYGRKYFNKEALRGVQDDRRITKYKLPPMFDDADWDDSKRTAMTGEKTFAQAGRHLAIDSEMSSKDDLRLPPIINDLSKSSTSGKSRDLTGNTEKLPSIMSSIERINASRDRLDGRTPSYRQKSEEPEYDINQNHLRYHHRGMYDSVPTFGLDITSMSSKEATNNPKNASFVAKSLDSATDPELTNLKSRSDSLQLQETPSMILTRINNSQHWCECSDVDLSSIKCAECFVIGGHEKWCVHAQSATQQGICPQCGKPIKKKHVKQPAKEKPKEPEDTSRHVRFEDQQDAEALAEHERYLEQLRNKSPEDEDYMEVDNMFEGKDRLWSPKEDGGKKLKRIDPDIHRQAYLKALLDVRLLKMKKVMEIDEHFYANQLRRPHVFSYFTLRPQQRRANEQSENADIGLKPVNDAVPRLRKAMKHIFGKIKVDDYYPGGKKNQPRVTMTIQKEAKKQTMPIHNYK